MARARSVIHVVSSLLVGGAEHVAIRLAKEQRAMGVEASVLALHGGPLEDTCVRVGVPYAVLGGRSGYELFARAAIHFAKTRPDAVSSHNPPAHSIARACKLTSRPVLAMTRHGEADRTSHRLVAAPITDGVIACSTRVRDAFRARHPTFDDLRLIVIENGVDLDRTASSDDALRDVRKPNHRVIVTVARLDPVKDLGTMIRALATLGARPVQLVIVGDGETRAELESLVRELHLESRVTFLGFRRDVAELLRASDVFALSSLSEGMPLAALEAMAAGLPVVATAVGGTPEVVEDGTTGLLVPSRDPAALGAALARVLDDDALRASMGHASRARVERAFSLRVTTERYLAAYEALRRARLPRFLVRRVS